MTPPHTATLAAAAHTRSGHRQDLVSSEVLRRACDRIAPLWPLDRFVAVNPYLGLADHTFDAAARLLARTVGASTTLPPAFYLEALEQGRITPEDVAGAMATTEGVTSEDVAELLTRVADDDAISPEVVTVADVATSVTGRDWERVATERVASWAAAYFDGGQATWRSADPDQPLFAAWLAEARIDRTPEVLGLRGLRAWVAGLPQDHTAAAQEALRTLDLPPAVLDDYLHRVLLRLGGWSAHAAWLGWEAALRGTEDDSLQQLLAVLLCWEAGLLAALATDHVPAAWQQAREGMAERAGSSSPPASASLSRRLVLQHAFDRAEQRRLVQRLHRGPVGVPRSDRPHAQAVFCIDVRSEVYRRHLEQVTEHVDTLGFAGFFGMPIEYVPLAHERGGARCPALLAPSHTVLETTVDEAGRTAAEDRRRLTHHVRRAWKSFKMGAITCFSFVGPVGLAYLPKLFTDDRGWTRPTPPPETEGLGGAAAARRPGLTVGERDGRNTGIDADDRVELAESALRGMSLTDGMAPLVVLAGHGATTTNNPYDSGLHCGACGGHTGEANARVAAQVLNDLAVRNALAGRGIHVPEDTRFVAALHDTTTDDVTVEDRELVPVTHRDLLAEVEQGLAEASRRTRAERAARFGLVAGDLDAAVRRRSTDWAQVRPEWGLAGCRAFVAAPRHRTRGIDLQGQSFLHDYDWRRDDGFDVLELIMTAPMVVASWISLQYYASTVDNDVLGSGNKTLHNVVGRLGVLEGNTGDLRVGLPWQSVHDGERHQHEPVRLNVVIEAPVAAMTEVLEEHDDVRELCDNGWLHLLAMDDDGRVSHRYVGDLRWEELAA